MRRYLQVLFILCGLAGLALLSSLPVAWAMPEQSALRFTVPTRTPVPQPTSPPPTSGGGGGGGSNPSPTRTPAAGATLTPTPPAGTKNLTPSPTPKAGSTVTVTPRQTVTPGRSTATVTAAPTKDIVEDGATPVTGDNEEVALTGDDTEETGTATIPPAVNVTATPVEEDSVASGVGIHPLFFWGIGLLGLGIVIIVLWRKLKV
ncbi:MAG: hypothetical protein JW981_09915 [Anaerolineae bacterium]|nr:hypothetical protein [Anaerolineae bacterium]